jgi:cellulose synthase/poly-beta-1,6-N-acetylglucosamine synthase-like glycosyltransferase
LDSLSYLAVILLSPLLLVNLVFVAELLAGLRRGHSRNVTQSGERVAIVIPAHNEERVIGRTLEGLKIAAAEEFDLLVVADNCHDRTAQIVRALGVSAVERNDPGMRGKGYALAFAREQLRVQPPAAVIILDADCRTDRQSLGALAGQALRLRLPCQAINLLEPNSRAGAMVQVSTFAFLVKNLVRQRGLQRLTGGVHLTGTGMCLPWNQFDGADLATSSIVEDVRLGVEMSRKGGKPQLVQDAVVWSPHADHDQTLTQRSRWEGGFLALAGATAFGMIANGVRKGRPDEVLGGLDLLIPPLALLALINVGALLFGGAAAVAGVGWVPFGVVAATGVAIGAALLLVWWREGRRFLSPRALLALPMYALWKVPMYLRLVRKGAPAEWVRTARPDEREGGS